MKSKDFYCNSHLSQQKPFEPLCVKFRWGSDLHSREGKSQKVSDSLRNDVSPLTQGLRIAQHVKTRRVRQQNDMMTFVVIQSVEPCALHASLTQQVVNCVSAGTDQLISTEFSSATCSLTLV